MCPPSKLETGDPADLVAQGQAALDDGSWEEARRCFAAAVAQHETGPALEGLSWAAWWLADADELFSARERAYRAYLAAGQRRDAARVATWLGTDSVDFRGEVAVAQGWLARARSLLTDSGPCLELGWLHVHEAEKLIAAGQVRRALGLGSEAVALGRQFRSVDLEMMGTATVGFAAVAGGDLDEGVARLGEAATAALAGELTQRWAIGWCCCYLIYACELARDYDRVAQWCQQLQAWSERRGIEFLNRSCRAHYAGVLIWRGTWSEAESELVESAARLARLRPPSAVEADVRLGELRRRQGRVEEAAAMFAAAAEHPLSILGMGELSMDSDDAAQARDRARECLREVPAEAAMARASALELLVRAETALGDLAAAHDAGAQLSALADRVRTDPMRAAAAYCRGVVASANGDSDTARIAFEDAIRLYARSGGPFEQARSRLALARELRSLDRKRDALAHASAAASALRDVGARREAERAEAFVRELEGHATSSPLTRRECDVLRLVAAGKTNREIADELVLSEHTVNRHVTNILTKLGTRTRSAAVAEALRRRLI